jgi:hypothetical protein
MVSAEDIVKYARSWIGTRWTHQGRTEKGIDCVGLLYKTAQHFNLPGEDILGYRRQPGREFLGHIKKFSLATRLPINGAIGIFNDTVMPCHTGVFAVDSTGHVTVIHAEAYPKRRVHEQDYNESSISLRSRLVDIRLFKEVTYV